jgi:hypothetical protein
VVLIPLPPFSFLLLFLFLFPFLSLSSLGVWGVGGFLGYKTESEMENFGGLGAWLGVLGSMEVGWLVCL